MHCTLPYKVKKEVVGCAPQNNCDFENIENIFYFAKEYHPIFR